MRRFRNDVTNNHALKRPLLLWLGVVSPLTQSSWRCMHAWSLLESLWRQIPSPKQGGSYRYFGFVSYSGGAISNLCLVPLAKIFHFKYKYLYIEEIYFICLLIFPGTQNFSPKNPKKIKQKLQLVNIPLVHSSFNFAFEWLNLWCTFPISWFYVCWLNPIPILCCAVQKASVC